MAKPNKENRRPLMSKATVLAIKEVFPMKFKDSHYRFEANWLTKYDADKGII